MYPKREAEQWKRSECDIGDEKVSIRVKLWNEKADVSFKQGMSVKLTNLVTDVYNGVVSVNSTATTLYEVCYINVKYSRYSLQSFSVYYGLLSILLMMNVLHRFIYEYVICVFVKFEDFYL